MSTYTLSIGDILDDLRTAIGDDLAVGDLTYTWQHKFEGPALRWVPAVGASDYPLISLEVAEAEVVAGARIDEHFLPVVVHALIKPDLNPAASVYQVTREMGEALIAQIMDADRFAPREIAGYGVDRESMAIDDLFDKGLGIYSILLRFSFAVEDDG